MTKECINCKYSKIENKDVEFKNKKSMYFKELVTQDFNCEKWRRKTNE